MSALPTIRPVNHAVIDGDLVPRTQQGSALSAAIGQVVAFELVADQARSTTGPPCTTFR